MEQNSGIPVGFCQCGCGERTRVHPKTNTAAGRHRGEPCRFIHGHAVRGANNYNWRGGVSMTRAGYRHVRVLGHPRANKHGYVYEHILIAEAALGRFIPVGVEVHHVDEDKANNGRGNLVICPDFAYHALLHKRTRAFDACGNANARRCAICHGYERQDNITVPRSGIAYHRSCAAERARIRKAARRGIA